MLQKLLKLALSAVFPTECIGCRVEGAFVCASCLAGIPVDTAHVINNPTKNLSQIYIATSYNNELLKQIIHQFKYASVAQFADILASLILQATHEINLKNYVLIPIPLHRKRLIMRGYNQSELIAKKLAAQWQLPLDIRLHRVKNNPSQTKLSRDNRFLNVEKIFRYDGAAAHTKVLLVDDITTTFATLDSAAAELLCKGAKKVIGVVVAKNDV